MKYVSHNKFMQRVGVENIRDLAGEKEKEQTENQGNQWYG